MTCTATQPSTHGLGDAVSQAYREFCGGYAHLLEAIAAHDRCDAYTVLGVRTEEQWLRRVFDLETRTARDWVRQARLVGAHPEIGAQLASGEVSVDKLRSMAELVASNDPDSLAPKGPFDDDPTPDPGPSPDPAADPAVDPTPDPSPDPAVDPSPGPSPDPSAGPTLTLAELLAMLAELNAAQLAARAAAARAEAARRSQRWRTRHLGVFRADGEGRLSVGRGNLYDDDAAVVFAAFEDYAARAGVNPETGRRDPLGMRYADALRAMADAYLAERERVLGHPLVFFHADAALLDGAEGAWAVSGADHSPVSPETLSRLICFSKLNLVLDGTEGNPLFLGRTQRLASWQQEAQVIYRDGGCRGCGATVGLEVHHMDEWTAEHGLTDVDRLALNCRCCHHLNHDRGWQLEGDPNAEVRLVDPGGVVRGRTWPHARFAARPRPPRSWLSPPPHEAADAGGGAPEDSSEDGPDASPPPTLW